MYRDIHSVIVDLGIDQAHQSCRTAAHVQQGATATIRDLIDDPRTLLHTIVRPSIVEILLDPEISFVKDAFPRHRMSPVREKSNRSGSCPVTVGPAWRPGSAALRAHRSQKHGRSIDIPT